MNFESENLEFKSRITDEIYKEIIDVRKKEKLEDLVNSMSVE